MVRVRFVVWASLLAVLLSAAPGAAQETVNTSFVTPESVGALFVRPSALLERKDLAEVGLDAATDKVEEQVGISPENIEWALIVSGPDIETSMIIVIRSKSELDPDDLLEEDSKEATHAGKKYHTGEPCVHFVDKRTVVLAEEDLMKQLLAQKQASGPLADALKKVDARKPATAVFALAPVRPLAQAQLGDVPADSPLAAYQKLPELVETVEISLGVNDLSLQLVLRGKDAAAGKTLGGLIQQGLAQAKALLAVQIATAEDDGQELAEMFKSANTLLGAIKSSVTADSVTITLDGKTIQSQLEQIKAGVGALSGSAIE